MTKINTNPNDWKMTDESTSQSDQHSSASTKDVDNLNQFQLLYQFYKDYKSERYTGVSKLSVIALMLGLFYVISPLDFIPEFSFGPIGLIDDAAITALVYNRLKKELVKYKNWLKRN